MKNGITMEMLVRTYKTKVYATRQLEEFRPCCEFKVMLCVVLHRYDTIH